MQNVTRIALGLGAAAVVASGGSAYTNSNTLSDTEYLGYDTATVTGITVTNIRYNVSGTNSDLLSTVVFSTGNNVSSGYTGVMTINGSTGTQHSCGFGAYATGTMDITCTVSGSVSVSSITSVGLSVSAQ